MKTCRLVFFQEKTLTKQDSSSSEDAKLFYAKHLIKKIGKQSKSKTISSVAGWDQSLFHLNHRHQTGSLQF